MPIVTSDIQFLLSGGASNTDPQAALGGAVSSTAVVDSSLNGLFDQVSGAESASGDTEYRLIYVKNNHGSLTLQNAKIYISTNTAATDTTIDIGLATQGDNGTASTIANENTAPSPTVTFSAPTNYAGGLSFGDLAAGHIYGVWVRWTITAGAAANNLDNGVFTVQGDTAA